MTRTRWPGVLWMVPPPMSPRSTDWFADPRRPPAPAAAPLPGEAPGWRRPPAPVTTRAAGRIAARAPAGRA